MRNRLDTVGIAFTLSLAAWTLWVAASPLITNSLPKLSSPYLTTPLMLLLGVGVGGVLRERWRAGSLRELAPVLLAIAAFAAPIYANASAAVGGLLVAIATLANLDFSASVTTDAAAPGSQPLDARRTSSCPPQSSSRTPAESDGTRQNAFVLGLGVIGVLLAFGSQAAALLLALLVVFTVLVIRTDRVPSRAAMVLSGAAMAVVSSVTVVLLAVRDSWPSWLSTSGSLSSARHELWLDALSLWKQHPLVGAGHGTFTPSSELASTTPHLEAAHSSILQVAAELGAIGVVLLGAIFISGLYLATQTSHVRGAVAAAAWTFLAVHSTIDHLEDFPAVALTAGLLLGWAGLIQTPHNKKAVLP